MSEGTMDFIVCSVPPERFLHGSSVEAELSLQLEYEWLKQGK